MLNRAPLPVTARGTGFGRFRAAVPCGAALLAALVSACEPTLEVVPTSYLAIVASLDGDAAATARGVTIRYAVAELSGTLGIDTVVNVTARDTVILPLPPATYTVALEGLPGVCRLRYGADQAAVVYAPPATTIVRYFAECRPALTIAAIADGEAPDSGFVYRLEGAGMARAGFLPPNDTVAFDTLPQGDYTVTLGHVAHRCVVLSDGGTRRQVTIDAEGGAQAQFRVTCADEARRPRLVAAAASAHEGAVAFTFRASDPDRNIERYAWDVTDCARHSLLPAPPTERRGLTSGRTRGQDTVQVVAAFEVPLTDDVLARACLALRVADEFGNSTPVTEVPLRGGGGRPPEITLFNASYSPAPAIATVLAASDPDGDLVGVFVAARLRDGVLGAADGQPDLGFYNAVGYLSTNLPQLPLTGRIQFGDVYAIIVYLVDSRGNFVRLEDTDPIH